MDSSGQTRRAALFTLADARGNNPHGTRETSEHESRRINAERYETVDQMDKALDSRARELDLRQQISQHRAQVSALQRKLGEVTPAQPPAQPPQKSSSLLEIAALVALGAGLMWLFVKDKPRKNPESDDLDLGVTPPAPAATTAVVAQPAALPVAPPAALPVAAAPVEANPAVMAVPTGRKSRRKAKVVQETVTTTTTTVPEGTAIVASPQATPAAV